MRNLTLFIFVILVISLSIVPHTFSQSQEKQAPRKIYSPEEQKQYEQAMQKYLDNSEPVSGYGFGWGSLKRTDKSLPLMTPTPTPLTRKKSE